MREMWGAQGNEAAAIGPKPLATHSTMPLDACRMIGDAKRGPSLKRWLCVKQQFLAADTLASCAQRHIRDGESLACYCVY